MNAGAFTSHRRFTPGETRNRAGSRHCFPGIDFTITLVAELCPNRATPELMTFNAKLGVLLPYRTAPEVLAELLPGQSLERHMTLRHRTLANRKRLKEKEEVRMFHEKVETRERIQRDLPVPGGLEREPDFRIDTAHIPDVRGSETRSFEAHQ